MRTTMIIDSFDKVPAGLQRVFEELTEMKQQIQALSMSKLGGSIPEQRIGADTLLTRPKAAEVLNVSLATVDNYTRTGTLKGYRVGNRVLYKETEVMGALTAIKATK